MRVDVLVTGRTEAAGIVPALTRLFPDHEFNCLVQRPRDGTPFDGFTTSRLPAPKSRARNAADKIVEAAAAHLVPGRNGDPPDFLVVLDDLELDNADQPAVAAQEFRDAVERHLISLADDARLQAKCSAALRDRASLHFANPMIEAWFFPDHVALSRAGVPAGTNASCAAGDPENFEAIDGPYLAAAESACPCWVERGREKKARPKWLSDHLQRSRHPKGYLQWLCRDGAATNCTTYH